MRLATIRVLAVGMSLVGCASSSVAPKDAERGPDGTVAFPMLVETSEPARIEANGENMGQSPVKLKVFGDKDGTFHNFNRDQYIITAYPVSGKPPQSKVYRTGGRLSFDTNPFAEEDQIPKRVYIDLNQAARFDQSSGQQASGRFTVDVPQGNGNASR